MKILLLAAGLLMAGCGYLNEEPLHYLQPQERFEEELQIEQALHMCYHYLPEGYNDIGNSFLDAATDDAVSSNEGSATNKLARGEYTAHTPVYEVWERCYMGISQTFLVTENLHYMNIPKGSSLSDPDLYFEEKRNEYGSEALMLRGYFYFELLRMYGGVPLVEGQIKTGADLKGIGRADFADVVKSIVNLCDSAAKYHPAVINATPGRWGKGAAKAIKAKTLAYAASDLYNKNVLSSLNGYMEGTQTERREEALDALAEVMEYTELGLANNYANIFTLAPNNAQFKKECIVYKGRPQNNSVERFLSAPAPGGNGGIFPTQEFVDSFDNADGTSFTSQTVPDATQWTGRDPRLSQTIVFNGSNVRNNTPVYTYVGTDETHDGFGVVHQKSTITGYYLKKFANYGSVNFNNATPGNSHHINPLIRYSDVVLLYAEMMNELYGPENADRYTLTAKAAVETVRSRGGITAPLPAGIDKDDFRTLLMNERRVELCFEGQRYFDIKRWEAADALNRPVHGMKITRTDDNYVFQKVTVDSRRTFSSQMYFAPIPYNEVMTLSIAQNPGW